MQFITNEIELFILVIVCLLCLVITFFKGAFAFINRDSWLLSWPELGSFIILVCSVYIWISDKSLTDFINF